MKYIDAADAAFDARMAAAEAHGALVRMAKDAAEAGDADTSLLAWLTTGSHLWPEDAPAE